MPVGPLASKVTAAGAGFTLRGAGAEAEADSVWAVVGAVVGAAAGVVVGAAAGVVVGAAVTGAGAVVLVAAAVRGPAMYANVFLYKA